MYTKKIQAHHPLNPSSTHMSSMFAEGILKSKLNSVLYESSGTGIAGESCRRSEEEEMEIGKKPQPIRNQSEVEGRRWS